jgi:predicted nucleic acid-binding protein
MRSVGAGAGLAPEALRTRALADLRRGHENGGYRLHPLSERTLGRASEIERQYASVDLGLVDASVIATSEELDEPKVATLDRRDFSVVRPRHRDRLLPR